MDLTAFAAEVGEAGSVAPVGGRTQWHVGGSPTADVREVRAPEGLEGLDGLVIPGGESTTMTLGIEREGMADPLRELAAAGTPVLGTCAGLIVLDREHLGVLDLSSRRNAFGRQIASFELDVPLREPGGRATHAVFIRAPWVEEHGDGVEVLAEIDGHPVAVRQGNVLAVSFHPELSGDDRLHRWLLALAAERSAHRPRTDAAA